MTVMGMSVPKLLAGTVIVENIFAWPGIGRLCVTVIFNRDFPVIQAPTPEWGMMLNEAKNIMTTHPGQMLAPGREMDRYILSRWTGSNSPAG